MTTPLISIGIDPGSSGAAVLLADGAPVMRRGFPIHAVWKHKPGESFADPVVRVRRRQAMATMLEEASAAGLPQRAPDAVVIEGVAINYSGKNQQGMAGLIKECGWWECFAEERGWPVQIAQAPHWLRSVARPLHGAGLGVVRARIHRRWPSPKWSQRKHVTKVQALSGALEHWPSVEWVPKRGRIPHDGLVDAALLALCGTLGRTWSVQRDGRGAGCWRDFIDPTTEYQARYVYDGLKADMKRGAARLLCDGEEVERWTT